jgi:hypothetical protein
VSDEEVSGDEIPFKDPAPEAEAEAEAEANGDDAGSSGNGSGSDGEEEMYVGLALAIRCRLTSHHRYVVEKIMKHDYDENGVSSELSSAPATHVTD